MSILRCVKKDCGDGGSFQDGRWQYTPIWLVIESNVNATAPEVIAAARGYGLPQIGYGYRGTFATLDGYDPKRIESLTTGSLWEIG